jgi:hypothetical protein
MLKQCLLLSALGFVGLIAVSALGQNIMDPAGAKFFDDAAVRNGNRRCPCVDHASVCGCVRTSASSPEWYQNGHFDPAKRTKELTKQLKLTADQQSQMLDTLKSTKSQLEAVRSDRSLSRKVRNCKLAFVRQASNDQISAFLEKKQNATLARMRSYKYNVDRSPVEFSVP